MSHIPTADRHLIYGQVNLSKDLQLALLSGLGRFREPHPALTPALHALGYYDRPGKVVHAMNGYRPRMLDPHRWARIRTFVEDSVAATLPHTTGSSQPLMSVAARFVEWAVFVRSLPLHGDVIWSKRTIEQYITSEHLALAKGTRMNYRIHLERIRQAVHPDARDFRYTAFSEKSTVEPYSDAELAAFREWALFQRTEIKRLRGMMTLTFCAGAGIRVSELGTLTHRSITREAGTYLVHVEGHAPRIVPLLSEWDRWMAEILKQRPHGELLWGSPNRTNKDNLVSSFTQYTVGTAPRADRLRNTWLITHLRNRVPMADLFYAAGVKKMEHLGRIIKHLPPLEAAEYRTIFRGEVAP